MDIMAKHKKYTLMTVVLLLICACGFYATIIPATRRRLFSIHSFTIIPVPKQILDVKEPGLNVIAMVKRSSKSIISNTEAAFLLGRVD